ncbi:PQQ-like beta-propeller repeat protein [Kribbella sp. NBC_01505]|uniref:outer membrane protein assembly factor BamB family protein n=1 Tax=Kribbella sp. NBC_01505 TaxID=2903580 RepID=UPI00386B730A
MTRRKIVAGSVAFLLVASAGAFAGVRWWGERCEAMVGPVPASQKVPSVHAVKPADVNLQPLAEDLRGYARDVLAQAARTPELGVLRSVAVAADEESLAPRDPKEVVGIADGAPLVLFDQRELRGKLQVRAGALTRLAGEAGGTDWARWYNGSDLEAVKTPYGLVLAQRPDGKVPQVTSVDPGSGKLHWCVPVGGEYTSAEVATGDSGLFVLSGVEHTLGDRPSTLRSLDPANGKTRWRARLGGFDDLGTVDVFGDKVLVTQWGTKVDDSVGIPQADNETGGVETDGGSLRAFHADNGRAAWEYAGPDHNDWAMSVVGVADATAVVLARRSPVPEHSWTRKDQNWLIGLGPDGTERWRQDLGNQISGHSNSGIRMAGDVVLRFESTFDATTSTQTVVARDASTGKVRWSKTVDGDQAFDQEHVAVADGKLLIAQSPNLVSVDLISGAVRPLLTDHPRRPVLDVKVDGRVVVAQAAGLILTFERGPR